MDRWLAGREITGAAADLTAAPRTAILGQRALKTLIGDRVLTVEAQGKHLLVRLSSGRTIHTHMRMQGSWHVYPAGERWQRPRSQARLVLEAGDHVAVCFNAPVVELLRDVEAVAHPSLSALGPDVLAGAFDLTEALTRAAAQPGATEIGDLLLDQRVVAGIGNIWRCETLFLAGLHPRRPVGSIGDDSLGAVFETASDLMRRSVSDGRGNERWVYGRTGRPCRRCGTLVVSRRVGAGARTAYWCPSCQSDWAPSL